MPCPPSYEEREMANLDLSTQELRNSLRILMAQGSETLDAVGMIREIARQNKVPEKILQEFRPVSQELAKAIDFDLKALLLKPKLSGTWPDQDELSLMQSYQERMLTPHNELELVLCKSRQLIYQISRSLAQLSVPLSANQEELFAREKDRHLAHREEERNDVIRRLKQLITYYRVQLRLQSEGQLKTDFDYQEGIEYLRQRIKRTQAFSDHELLNDRILFFRGEV